MKQIVVSWRMWAGAGALAVMGSLPAWGDEQPALRLVRPPSTWTRSPPQPPVASPQVPLRVLDSVEYVIPSEGRSNRKWKPHHP